MPGEGAGGVLMAEPFADHSEGVEASAERTDPRNANRQARSGTSPSGDPRESSAPAAFPLSGYELTSHEDSHRLDPSQTRTEVVACGDP